MSEAAAKSANQAVSSSRARATPQRGPAPSGPGSVSAAIAKLHAIGGNHAVHALLGGGAPLPFATQDEFGKRFGTDFTSVRIHDDAAAHGSAADLAAKAYAVGERIVFSAGRYDVHSGAGKRLLAHELAHVVQQRRGGRTPTLAPSGAHEQGADAAAYAFVSGPGPVAVQGATSVGVARAPDDQAQSDFYATAFHANRYWFWGYGKPIEGWPVDEKLAGLWQALGVSSTEKGKEGTVPGTTLAHRPEFIEFADTVRNYQRDKMNRKGLGANGVVDAPTADALRKDPITPRHEKTVTRTGNKEFTVTRHSARAVGGMMAAGSGSASVSSDSLGMIGDAAIDALASQIAGGEGLQQRMIAAAMHGFLAEMQTQLVDEEKAKHARDHLMELLNPKVGAAYGLSYLAGLIPGFLSPVTDLFGIPAFMDSASDFVQNVEKKIAEQAVDLANEGSEIRTKLRTLKTESISAAKDIFQDLAKDPKQIFALIDQATGTASGMAVNMANSMGHSTAAAIIHLFESPWEEEKEEDPGWSSVLPKDPLSISTMLNPGWAAAATTSRAWEYGTERLKGKIFTTPWSKVGYAIGHAMGALLANLLLLVFTDGIGDAIAALGKGLSEIAPALRALETVAVKIAEALKLIGGAIKTVEEGIAAVAKTILKPLEKVLKPLEELLGSLTLWLRKCLGVVEKDPEALAEAGVKVLKLKQPPKVEPHFTGGTGVADDATKLGSKVESKATPMAKPKVEADPNVHPVKDKPDVKANLPTKDKPVATGSVRDEPTDTPGVMKNDHPELKKDPEPKKKPNVKKDPEPKKKPDVTKDPEATKKPAAKKDSEAKKKPAAKKDAEPKKKPAVKKDAEPKKKPAVKKDAEPKKKPAVKKDAEPKKKPAAKKPPAPTSDDPLVVVKIQGSEKGEYWPEGTSRFESKAGKGGRPPDQKYVVMPKSQAEDHGFRPAGTPAAKGIKPRTINGTQVESSGAGRDTHPITARATRKPGRSKGPDLEMSKPDPSAQHTFPRTIGADTAQAAGYNKLLDNGELGLLRPGNVSTGGVDAITVRINASGEAEIYLNDFTAPGVAKPSKATHQKWLDELDKAIAGGRLDFGDKSLESAIQSAATRRVFVRPVFVTIPQSGGGTVVTFGSLLKVR